MAPSDIPYFSSLRNELGVPTISTLNWHVYELLEDLWDERMTDERKCEIP